MQGIFQDVSFCFSHVLLPEGAPNTSQSTYFVVHIDEIDDSCSEASSCCLTNLCEGSSTSLQPEATLMNSHRWGP